MVSLDPLLRRWYPLRVSQVSLIQGLSRGCRNKQKILPVPRCRHRILPGGQAQLSLRIPQQEGETGRTAQAGQQEGPERD